MRNYIQRLEFGRLRGAAKHALVALPWIFRFLVIEYALAFAAWYVLADGLKDLSGTPLGADFLNVYTAGQLTNLGLPELAYNWDVHHLTEQSISGYASPFLAWLYPPPFFLVASLLAQVPYLCAFVLYMAVSFLGYGMVVRRLLPQAKEYLWAFAAFPGVFANISNGQNGFITTALFGAGMLELDKRPWLAGALFGLLSYKPQLFVVIPLILAVGGYGRALLAAVASAVACGGFSWVLFGTKAWLAFFDSIAPTRATFVEAGATGWQKIQSVFSLARMWGCDTATAYVFQIIVAMAALACAGWVWRQQATLATRTAALCAAVLLSTPYLLDYDLVILAVPLALLFRQGAEIGFLPQEKLYLAALWLLPLLARCVGAYYLPLTPPMLIVLLALCVERTAKEKHAASLIPAIQ